MRVQVSNLAASQIDGKPSSCRQDRTNCLTEYACQAQPEITPFLNRSGFNLIKLSRASERDYATNRRLSSGKTWKSLSCCSKFLQQLTHFANLPEMILQNKEELLIKQIIKRISQKYAKCWRGICSSSFLMHPLAQRKLYALSERQLSKMYKAHRSNI